MTSYNADQKNEFHQTFSLFDKTGKDAIPLSAFGDVCRALGQNPTNREITKILGAPSDNDMKNKHISFDQFLPMLHSLTASDNNINWVDEDEQNVFQQEFVEGLKIFDKEGNGCISSAELRHVLSTMGEYMSETEINQLLMGFEDMNGMVNYEDFIRAILNWFRAVDYWREIDKINLKKSKNMTFKVSIQIMLLWEKSVRECIPGLHIFIQDFCIFFWQLLKIVNHMHKII